VRRNPTNWNENDTITIISYTWVETYNSKRNQRNFQLASHQLISHPHLLNCVMVQKVNWKKVEPQSYPNKEVQRLSMQLDMSIISIIHVVNSQEAHL
jgi:hypothetical protein